MPCYDPPWEGSAEEAESMFQKYGLRMSEKNLMQALLCQSCQLLEDEIGPLVEDTPLARWWQVHKKKDKERKDG